VEENVRKLMLFSWLCLSFFVLSAGEKDRLAVMDVTDETGKLSEQTIINVTDYIFTRFQSTGVFWMIPKTDRDTALDAAIEETKIGSRKECVDEKCQLSLVAELQANFLINTKIKQLYEGTCQISISKFDVEKRAGVFSWENKFDCTEKSVFEAIDGFNFSGKKAGSSFQSGKIGETVEDWEVGAGEETIVKFESDPTDAIVLVDGRIVCQKTPCSKMVTMGKHNIVIQKENYLPNEKNYDIKKSQSIKEMLDPDFGWLTVSSPVEIDVLLDGQNIGKAPLNKKVVSPGAHQIETDNECFYKTGEKFQIKRGETKSITLDLKPKESAIKVTARDDKGNDLEADVFVDGKKVGTAPGTFKVPVCSRNLLVKSKGIEFNKKLELQEKKILKIDASLKKVSKWSSLSPKSMTWSDAKEYCENLEENEYDDWRLPTISELKTLITCPRTLNECGINDKCLSSEILVCRKDFDVCSGCWEKNETKGFSKLGDSEIIWSSSITSDKSWIVWVVNFKKGQITMENWGKSYGIGENDTEQTNFVRCIR